MSQGVGDINKFLSILKQRLTDSFIQNWRKRLNESSRASFYKEISAFNIFKHSKFKKKYRNALTKLRLSSHRLFIESGRWNSPQPTPREERKCTICNILEDEFHFLLECRMYDEFRYSFIKPYYARRKSIQKTVELLQSTNKNMLKNLAVYIFKGFEIFRQRISSDKLTSLMGFYVNKVLYSRLSLSRLRLSRITLISKKKSGPYYNTEI